MTNKRAAFLIIMFLVLIYGIAFGNLVKGNTAISVYENRTLEKCPGLKEIETGTFAPKFESFFSDHFILRDTVIKWDTMFDLYFGKTIVKNMYIVNKEWLFPKLDIKVNKGKVEKQAEELDALRDELRAQGKSFHVVFTPYRSNVLSYMYPEYAAGGLGAIPENLKIYTSCLEARGIDYANLDEYFLRSFSRKELEGFYFKTDHHWNMAGAYEGFKYMIETLKNSDLAFKDLKIDDNDYSKTYLKDKTFSGSYNKNLYNLFDADEDVPFVLMKNNPPYRHYVYQNGVFVEKKHEDMFFYGRNQNTVTYDQTYSKGEAFCKIINNNAKTNKKILIYKDSYQAATTLFFADVFEEVYIIDPRYVGSVDLNARKMASTLDVDIVMPMFNSESLGYMFGLMLK